MNPQDSAVVETAAAYLTLVWGSPVGGRDYALGVMVGLLIGGQEGQFREDGEVLAAVDRAVAIFRAAKGE